MRLLRLMFGSGRSFTQAVIAGLVTSVITASMPALIKTAGWERVRITAILIAMSGLLLTAAYLGWKDFQDDHGKVASAVIVAAAMIGGPALFVIIYSALPS